jgi:hypothetical protein
MPTGGTRKWLGDGIFIDERCGRADGRDRNGADEKERCERVTRNVKRALGLLVAWSILVNE